MPIRNLKYEVIGVFQVIKKFGGNFTEADEDLLVTIGASAGIALENNRLFETQQKMLLEQKRLFNGFIDTLSASIDARDKITAGHSMRVTQYSVLLCQKTGNRQRNDRNNLASRNASRYRQNRYQRFCFTKKKVNSHYEEYQHIQEHVKITHDILSKIAEQIRILQKCCRNCIIRTTKNSTDKVISDTKTAAIFRLAEEFWQLQTYLTQLPQ